MALNRSDRLAAKAIYHALAIIQTDGTLLSSGEWAMNRGAILDELHRREMALFDAWERGLRSSRAPRWQEELLRHSSNYVNAGYLSKERGVWYLTSSGAAAQNTCSMRRAPHTRAIGGSNAMHSDPGGAKGRRSSQANRTYGKLRYHALLRKMNLEQ